jgi:hypothetical protein
MICFFLQFLFLFLFLFLLFLEQTLGVKSHLGQCSMWGVFFFFFFCKLVCGELSIFQILTLQSFTWGVVNFSNNIYIF